MRPERFLGQVPSPGELVAIDETIAVLREVVLVLAESRQRIERFTGPDSIWLGAHAAGLVATLGETTTGLRVIEDAVVTFSGAIAGWRSGVAERQDRTAGLAEEMSQLTGVVGTESRRESVAAKVDQVAVEHRLDAGVLVAAAEDLTAAVVRHDDTTDLAADLQRFLAGVSAAVEQWVADAERDVVATMATLAEVTGLTSVVTHLMAVSPDGTRVPEAPAVTRLAAVSAGSHRLSTALHADWRARDTALPVASFAASPAPGRLAERLRGARPEESR